MSLVVVETSVDQPITAEFLKDADSRVLPCLQARNAVWRYSLLSSNRQRMICTFEAPDAESVRESYRKAGIGFGKMWAAQIITPDGIPPVWDEPNLKVIESTYPNGFTDEQWQNATQLLLPCYADHNIEWIRSYVSLDRTRMVCELNAPDAETIRQTHRKFEIPFDSLWSAQLLKS
jgi:hypothetical protein